MPLYRGIATRELPDSGWSSVYYFDNDSHALAMTALDLVNSAEMSLLPSQVKAGFLKVSDVVTKGDVLIQYPVADAGLWVGDLPGSIPADPNYALTLTWMAGVAKRSRHFLRGLPSEFVVIVDPARYKFTAPWGAVLATYMDQVQGSCVIATRPKEPNGLWTSMPIDGHITLPASSDSVHLSIRRAGRPFGLRRGRRMTA
jgi:hypothetical protein